MILNSTGAADFCATGSSHRDAGHFHIWTLPSSRTGAHTPDLFVLGIRILSPPYLPKTRETAGWSHERPHVEKRAAYTRRGRGETNSLGNGT